MKTKFETIQSKIETIASERSAWARGVKDLPLQLIKDQEKRQPAQMPKTINHKQNTKHENKIRNNTKQN